MSHHSLRLASTVALLAGVATSACAQEPTTPPRADTTAHDTAAVTPTKPPPAAPVPAPATSSGDQGSKVYYGGTLTAGFSGATSIGIFPMVGYKLNPKASLGVEVGYQYTDFHGSGSTSAYGGSLFGRYRFVPRLYGMAEWREINYEFKDVRGNSSRDWVPFLLLGGGIVQRAGARASAYLEVLWDVLQDSKSPYDAGVPFVSLGVAVGF